MELFKLKLHPSAGFIPNFEKEHEPGLLNSEEKEYLRDLARKIMEISNLQKQAENREMWKRHNSLEKGKPMLLVFPEDSWFEIIGEETLRIQDSYWKQWEWYFKHIIYRFENLNDDFVVEKKLQISSVFKYTGWGLEIKYNKVDKLGSYTWEAPVKDERDIEKLKFPTAKPDHEATSRLYSTVGEMFGDIIPVEVQCGFRKDANIIGDVVSLRGMENVMTDIYDRPAWLHELIGFVTEGTLKLLKSLEKGGNLTLNNKNHYTGSGGIGYTDELPAQEYDCKNVRLCDLWGHADAQEFSLVSPRHHEEFALEYQIKILKEFGLNSYGCCEPLTKKFDIVKKIPNLRRVSISPWCNIKTASEELEDKYIFSWKPNPAMLVENFDPDFIRKYIRNTLEITRGNILEIILKDTITLNRKPERLSLWIKIAREEIERVG